MEQHKHEWHCNGFLNFFVPFLWLAAVYNYGLAEFLGMPFTQCARMQCNVLYAPMRTLVAALSYKLRGFLGCKMSAILSMAFISLKFV